MGIVIGLTGPTGAGKSSLSETARRLGVKVIDCDLLARKAVEKGSEGLAALCTAFGEDILCEDETLNRKKLAEKAFSTPQSTELLNQTILPFIAAMVKKEAENVDALLDAPTLFESGADSICEDTVAVLAGSATRLERIMARDGISEAEALLRMKAGKPDSFYKEKAGHIIYNDGDKAEFIQNTEKLFTKLFRR